MNRFFQFVKNHKSYFADALILFGLMIIFFSRWIFFDRYLLFCLDIVQDFATHHYAAFSWSRGIIPIWDPYFFGPVVGYLTSGIFYPPNLLMDFLQILTYQNLNHGYILWQVNTFLHSFLASFFMYLLVRQFAVRRTVAVVAGIIFAYCGLMVKNVMHLPYLQGATWLPLFFLFAYKAVSEKKNWVRYSILTGVVFGISLLAGQTQPAIYFVFLLLILSLYAAHHFMQTKEEKPLRPFLSFLVAVVVAFGIFSIQFFPTYEYKKYTPRDSIEYSYSVGYSADPLYFIFHSFVPSFWGTMQSKFWDGLEIDSLPQNDQPKWLDRFWGGLPNEMTLYSGLLPFFLLPFAAFSKNRFLRNFLFILLFSSLLLLMARFFPLVGRLYWMVIGGVARVPARATVLWSFSLSFLSALGLQTILDLRQTQKDAFNRIVRVNFFILAALVFIFFPVLVSFLLSQAGKQTMVYFAFPLLNSFSLFLIFFLIYSVLILCLVRLRQVYLALFFVSFFAIIDIFSAHMDNSFVPAGNAPELVIGTSKGPEIGYLKSDKSFFRVQGLGLAAYANNLYSLGYGTAGLFGFAYRPAMELYSIIQDDASPIYDLLNIKYIYPPGGKLGDFKSSIFASSFLPDHRPYDAFDGSEENEWVVDPKKIGSEKAWLMATFRKQEIVGTIEFLGRDNGRDKEIKTVELSFSDGSAQSITLPAKKGWKQISIAPVKTDWIKFTVVDLDETYGRNDTFGFKEIILYGNKGERAEIGSRKFQKISGLNLYLNKNVFPRVFITHSFKSFKNRNEMFSAILQDQTGEQIRKNAFIYLNFFDYGEPQIPYENSRAVIKEYESRKVVIEAEAAANGFLILSDIWYPGWKAYIDGKKTPVFSAYNALRAVRIPKGKHTIIFKYNPWSFKIGASITVLTAILLIVYFKRSSGSSTDSDDKIA